MHLRENKSITIDPVGVFGVESHAFVEKNVGNRCHAHGRAGVAGVGFEGGINLHIRLQSVVFWFALLNRCSWTYPWWKKQVGLIESSSTRGTAWGRSYREETDSVDGKLVILSITHDCGDVLSNGGS